MTFTTAMKPMALPGQFCAVDAEKKSDGTYQVDSDFRFVNLIHSISDQGYYTTFLATDDDKNSFPITGADRVALFNEYMLVNNAEAMDMRMGGEIDLLIALLAKAYNS